MPWGVKLLTLDLIIVGTRIFILMFSDFKFIIIYNYYKFVSHSGLLIFN